jgi:hypothetical protein
LNALVRASAARRTGPGLGRRNGRATRPGHEQEDLVNARRRAVIVPLALVALVAARGVHAAPKSGPYAPHIDPANFQAPVDHPYFPLVPGTTYRYRETEGKRTSENVVTVTSETKVLMGVTCVVVHDVVKDGERVVEDTYDWYAQDKQGNVWYFGEDTKEASPKGNVSTEGSWAAGVNGGLPGIIMKGQTAVSEPYRQEYSRGTAEDMGQIVAIHESVTVPYGTFTDCVKTRDWSLLEAGYEYKWYAKGVGVVRSESTSKELSVLLSITRP